MPGDDRRPPDSVDAFITAMSEPLRSQWRDAPGLATALDQALVQARQAWPQLAVDDATFVGYLAERITEQDDITTLAALDLNALYLTCACAQGDNTAITAFRSRYARDIDIALARLHLEPATADDVRQTLLGKLFVAGSTKIRAYSGRGALNNWVRAVTVRHALSAQRRRAPLDRVDGEAATESPVPDDPELNYLKQHYRREFKAAFAAALAELTDEDRLLLRAKLVDGLTLEQLAHLHGVHRATAARRLAKLREQLLISTRTQLAAQLKVGRQEFDSIIRLIQSNFEVSVAGLLEPR